MNVLVIDCIIVDIAYCFINNPIVAFLLCQQSVVWAAVHRPDPPFIVLSVISRDFICITYYL